jgi:hypothetical protein
MASRTALKRAPWLGPRLAALAIGMLSGVAGPISPACQKATRVPKNDVRAEARSRRNTSSLFRHSLRAPHPDGVAQTLRDFFDDHSGRRFGDPELPL